MNQLGLAQALLASVSLLALLLLPGFALEWRWPTRPGTPEGPIRALIASIGLQILIGGTLVATTTFSATAMAAVSGVGILAGAVPAARWLRRSLADGVFAPPVIGATVLLGAWVLSAIAPGSPRSDTFQWYYWGLGDQVDAAAGIPSWVLEYGQQITWLPDYVAFTFLSEAYRGLMGGLGAAPALSAWRIPVAWLALLLLYPVLRCWVRPVAAVGGVAAVATSAFFLGKFNVYKPEALAIVLGLAAIWSVITGVRSARPGLVVLAGVSLGLAMAVHPIGATVLGLVVAAAGLMELLRAPERRRTFRALAAGGLAGIVLTLAVGWGLQGRLLVVGQALRPHVVDGVDPTWVYSQRSRGFFTETPVPQITRQLSAEVFQPWGGLDLRSLIGVAVISLVAVGVVLAILRGSRDLRAGALSIVLVGGAVVAIMAYAVVASTTYVPRHTALNRMGDYVPLFAALFVVFAVEGWTNVVTGTIPTARSPRIDLAWLVVAIAILLAPLFVTLQWSGDARLSAAAETAFEQLRAEAAPTDVTVTNAITYGVVEVATGSESPLEGRQPFIEEVGFLTSVSDLLLQVHQYLEDPSSSAGRAGIEGLQPTWWLITDDARALGATKTFGGGIAQMQQDPTLTQVWRHGPIAIFRSNEPRQPQQRVGPPRQVAGQWAAAVGLVGLAGVGIGLFGGLASVRRAEGRPC